MAQQRQEEYAATDVQSMLFNVALEQEEYETEAAAADATIMEELDAIREREKDQPKKRKTSPSKPKADGTGVCMMASEVPKGGILPKRLHDEPAALSSSMPLRLASGVAKTVKDPSETTSATKKGSAQSAATTPAKKGPLDNATSPKKGKARGSPAMGVTPDRQRKIP
jgi:hypothetical protein